MNKISRENLEAYYKEAEGWSHDRIEALRKSRKAAWIVGGVAAAVALLEAVALIALTPLKTVVPYTLLVDRQTGYVQALDPINPAKVTGDTALTQSFLVQYVTAREGFDADSVQAAYRRTALWSAEKARADYVGLMQGTNPNSPLQVYPRGTIIDVRVKSVSPLAKNVAMVRFDTVRRDAGGQAVPVGSWAAIIRYRFTPDSMSAEDRFVNPLGFQVVRYRRDAEALPPPEAAAQDGQAGPPVAPSLPPGTSAPATVAPAPARAQARPAQPERTEPEVEL
jgi:type IV secretion system protein VirB8